MTRARPLADRFWSHVDRGADCWLWTGALFGGTGYGSVYVAGRGNVGAHRVSWELHNAEPIPDGMQVCHRCDVRNCVNPGHLFVGTRSDNMVDCRTKGRSVQQTKPHLLVRGEQVNTARLTEEQVRQIRSSYESGRSNQSLASEYGRREARDSENRRAAHMEARRMSPALAISQDANKQLRNALGRTALQLLGAAYLDMEQRQDYPPDPRGLHAHEAPRWCRWAQIAFENYRLGCGHDAAEIFSYARSMRPWVGEVNP